MAVKKSGKVVAIQKDTVVPDGLKETRIQEVVRPGGEVRHSLSWFVYENKSDKRGLLREVSRSLGFDIRRIQARLDRGLPVIFRR